MFGLIIHASNTIFSREYWDYVCFDDDDIFVIEGTIRKAVFMPEIIPSAEIDHSVLSFFN